MPNQPTIKVRRLVQGEGDVYRQIRLEALQSAPDAFGSSYQAEAAWPLSHFEESVASGCILGAFDGGKIIGVAGFYQQSGLKQNHKGVLWGMYVNSGCRKSGAGKKLLQAVIDHATGVVDLLTLTVVEGNESAIALYANMGFRTYGTEPRALKIGTRYLAEALMVRDLD
ncbi:MAG: GNAT family N-acetyltransferase [Hoeflea sp.]|uniref:GNAT family N-acetyltransferase n=1 Tax=Hoeflea sp. TaxID=1940281 RepID=UPI003EF124E5